MSTLTKGFHTCESRKPLALGVKLAGLALLSGCAMFCTGLALLAQDGKAAADVPDGLIADAPNGPSLVVAGYTRPGSPPDKAGGGKIAPGGYLAGEPDFEGMGGTVFFAVFRRTRDEGDVWGTDSKELGVSFVPGGDYNDNVSPTLDTRAKYLYVYQVVNSRGLDPISPAIFAVNRDKGTQPIASMAVRVRMDPRYITSWGHFKGTGFNLAVMAEDLGGNRAAVKAGKDNKPAVKPAIEEDPEGTIRMAVSADPSILNTVDRNAYIWGAPAHRLRQTSLGGATLNLANSPATRDLERRLAALKKNQERPAAWAEQMLNAARKATEPATVRMVMFEPNAEVFVQADWTSEGHGLLNLGDHSTVFGFTTDLPPTTVRGSGIATLEGRPELLPILAGLSGDFGAPGAAAESSVLGMGAKPSTGAAPMLNRPAAVLPFLINLMGEGIDPAAGEVLVLAQGGGGVAPGTVVGPSPQPTFGAPTPSAPGASGTPGGGAGGGAGLPLGGPGGIGTAPTPFFGGAGGTGGGTGGGTSTQTPGTQSQTGTQGNVNVTVDPMSPIQTTTVNTNISLQNQQSQSQSQAQAQSQSESQSQSPSQTNVVPEPWALLSAALGLPVLFYLYRRRRLRTLDAASA
jgi:hypothetical protein